MAAVDFETLLLHCICFGSFKFLPARTTVLYASILSVLQKNGYSSRGDPSRNGLEQGHLQIQIINLEVEHQ